MKRILFSYLSYGIGHTGNSWASQYNELRMTERIYLGRYFYLTLVKDLRVDGGVK